jgi:signal peptidase II
MPALVVVCLVLIADRVTKEFVASRLRAGKPVPIGHCLRMRPVLTRWRGAGVAHDRAMVLLWLAVLAGIVVAVGSGRVFQHPTAHMGLSAALAGAASNLYDRVARGAVVDFIDLGWWPIFNVADVSITLGVLIALVPVGCACIEAAGAISR